MMGGGMKTGGDPLLHTHCLTSEKAVGLTSKWGPGRRRRASSRPDQPWGRRALSARRAVSGQ